MLVPSASGAGSRARRAHRSGPRSRRPSRRSARCRRRRRRRSPALPSCHWTPSRSVKDHVLRSLLGVPVSVARSPTRPRLLVGVGVGGVGRQRAREDPPGEGDVVAGGDPLRVPRDDRAERQRVEGAAVGVDAVTDRGASGWPSRGRPPGPSPHERAHRRPPGPRRRSAATAATTRRPGRRRRRRARRSRGSRPSESAPLSLRRHQRSALPRARAAARARRVWSSSTLRMRTASGVTSTHSSSRQNSRDCSRESLRGGTSRSSTSAAGGAHVGELLLLGDVDVHVVDAGVLADDHALVDLGRRGREHACRAPGGSIIA